MPPAPCAGAAALGAGPVAGIEREKLPRNAAVDLDGPRLVPLARHDERRALAFSHVEREGRGAEIGAIARDRRVAWRHADQHLVREGREGGRGRRRGRSRRGGRERRRHADGRYPAGRRGDEGRPHGRRLGRAAGASREHEADEGHARADRRDRRVERPSLSRQRRRRRHGRGHGRRSEVVGRHVEAAGSRHHLAARPRAGSRSRASRDRPRARPSPT